MSSDDLDTAECFFIAGQQNAARAQLAAIQGGMGEVVEVVGYLIEARDEIKVVRLRRLAEKEFPAHMKEARDWAGPFTVSSEPLMTVAQHQRITAAMAAEVAELKESMAYRTSLVGRLEAERDALRAELAEVKGREAVAEVVHCNEATGHFYLLGMRRLQAGAKLYASPPASPDVEGLVKALETFRDSVPDNRHAELSPVDPYHIEPRVLDEIDAALAAWRQAQEGKA